MEGPAAAEAARAVMEGQPGERGEIVLTVGSPFPQTGELEDGEPAPRTPRWWPPATPRSPRCGARGRRRTPNCWPRSIAAWSDVLAPFGFTG